MRVSCARARSPPTGSALPEKRSAISTRRAACSKAATTAQELAEIFRAIATVFSWRGESREAALALLRVVAEAGDDRLAIALALIEGGRLQMEIGRPADAQALFARALAASAELPRREFQRAWVNLLQASVAAGHIEQARAQLGAMNETLAGAPPRLLLLTELEAARCALAARDFAAATDALDRAALHAPESVEAFERVEIAEVQAEFALARGDAANAAALLAHHHRALCRRRSCGARGACAARASACTGSARPRRRSRAHARRRAAACACAFPDRICRSGPLAADGGPRRPRPDRPRRRR